MSKPLITDTNKHNQDLDAIEGIMDSIPTYAYFLELVAEVCSLKADRMHEGWQNETLEELWNHRAAVLLEASFNAFGPNDEE